ncbi:hypothetical protein [Sphingomonas rubra]|uniref:Ferritin-like domain-containing protein n=1 Tax=Sphingomonas rubra TaxID=634430 RepID=A0A1I5SG81_9SPHN|nr:hypothetical protein [Sphingomonas rubra]SFP69774.1 hypothetical protein SAMN04488241_105213 [Sphingomonas rubra]
MTQTHLAAPAAVPLPIDAAALHAETRAAVALIGPRLSEPVGRWRRFVYPELFQSLTQAMIDDDTALLRRLEHLSNEEGCGAEIIRGFADRPPLAAYAKGFHRHADDEIAHQRRYAGLAVELAARVGAPAPRLHDTDPEADLGIDFDAELHELVLSIHLGELRNLMNMDLMIPPLLAAEDEGRRRIGAAMLPIRADEIEHIRYLSRIVNGFLDQGLFDQAKVDALAAAYDRFWWADIARVATQLGGEQAA